MYLYYKARCKKKTYKRTDRLSTLHEVNNSWLFTATL